MLDVREDEKRRGRGARLQEFDWSANVVKAASVARQTLTDDAERWFCELDGMFDNVRECRYHHHRQAWRVLWTPAV